MSSWEVVAPKSLSSIGLPFKNICWKIYIRGAHPDITKIWIQFVHWFRSNRPSTFELKLLCSLGALARESKPSQLGIIKECIFQSILLLKSSISKKFRRRSFPRNLEEEKRKSNFEIVHWKWYVCDRLNIFG